MTLMDETAPVILNVDDREAGRYTKSRHLKKFGYAVIEAVDGAETLRKVEEFRPAVVLLDVRLPDMSGIDVCQIIKEKWPEVMVLQTSATFINVEDRIRGLNRGADSYLIQPAEPEELGAAVGALLRIRRAEDNLRAMNEVLEERVKERTADLEELNDDLRREIKQRETVEAALVQAQKMEAVGHLTGGLAHDFNNLLTAIVGNLDLIRRRSQDSRVLRLAENALKAAERGSKLTAQLLAFSRTQKLASRPVEIGALINGMSEMLSQTLGRSIEVVTDLAPDAGLVWADDNQLEVALLNLAINARDAMPNGGKLTISARRQTVDAADGDLDPGDYVAVSVSDTGHGMAHDIMAKAFDPFFTTKPPGKGTGLGLAQVYGISRQCGGSARIDSEIGKGTTVAILLKRADNAASAAAQAEIAHDGHAGAAEILLIDDDVDVRETLNEMLLELGYAVKVAESGTAGLELLQQSRPDLVLLDFAMPQLSGAEVATLIRSDWPELPIIFISGYADTQALAAAVGTAALLRKPFRRAELAATLRDALSSGDKSTD
jgi:DNA-binding response OmpR family regulator/nitrogen-specific signal transduction histidine kinase